MNYDRETASYQECAARLYDEGYRHVSFNRYAALTGIAQMVFAWIIVDNVAGHVIKYEEVKP